ncbi:chitin-binding protein [Micromonospora phaseoli]|uniref:Chitin-binding protein n=1 Tax=Micromonospora phaseoli TaxID=1144548 RepID=A0A1H7CNS2_9ACTN|nr:lytic polysaccharide monooxygenase [Micromonospora phaseoli]PZV91649.1 chitin-binding protein [Micromonospora phaseoli]GIJ79280.1 hypothetical protein Xph01_37120 [Micromonospora phaseoli]SEJ91289.1 chitin-binding protein [Micromonospora phaseoli]
MTVRRIIVAALAGIGAATAGAAPAIAQGAPTYPVSRSAGCAPDGEYVDTPACRAAIGAGAALREWDNVRVFGVDGRDRQRIPDGELCSGGLSAYRGLDLARTDWPSTPLTAGAEFVFQYRTTIPHEGTFRLYLTRAGHPPTGKLTWADLDTLPFLRLTDPPLRDGAYQMPARLPADRTGRHVIYTIWQNSDSQDTYYSCSDVEIQPAGTATVAPTTGADPATGVDPATGAVATTPAADDGVGAGEDPTQVAGTIGGGASVAAPGNVPVSSVTYLDGHRWPLVAGGALLLLLLVSLGMRLRGSRTGPVPGRACTVRNHRANPRVW